VAEQPTAVNDGQSMWRWWPCLVGGFCGPLLAHVLVAWFPLPVAVGLASFVIWVIVGVVFTVSPPSTRWNFMRWTAGGALGSLVAGLLALVIHG